MALFKRFMNKSKRPRSTSQTNKKAIQFESLETRRLLAADVVGDSNFDGRFDSGDLVQVFSHGKYETGEDATFAQGDWNGDGEINENDEYISIYQCLSRNKSA